MNRNRWMLAVSFSLACQPSGRTPPPPSAPPAPKATATATPLPPTAKGEAAEGRAARLSVGRLRTFRTKGDLVDLEDGVRLTRAQFEALVLRASAQVAGKPATAVNLALDDQSPRPLLGPSVPLRSVVDEDRELSPGWHVLLAFSTSGQDVVLDVAHFQLELEVPRDGREAGCILFAPGGTVHSTARAALELEAAPLADDVTQFEYFERTTGARLRVPGLETASVVGLPSGDHRLGVRCFDARGALMGESERIVTINADEERRWP